ncbi:hypothetical protein FRB99_004592 [Tulasnella sp. 403]|nr:hypothetical protein FRB99_004592 [Tulasnella sp. 403]
MDGPTHLLSLKVMRVSKPSLATSTQPFFSTSPALSAHASASLLSLQGARPLPGHPKTLRDFSLQELLTLPSNFGAISLGETFTSVFCVNNESDVAVSGVHLKMEIQTVTTKIPLAEFGGLEQTLQPNEPLQGVVDHEIKELNQHVLACTVSYLLPESLAHAHNIGPPEDPSRPNLRVFRKYYKFTVSNPLSVKTKVHVPKSPTATMDRIEREKVFLEVHVQNVTSEPLCFERMKLECVEGWEAQDLATWDPQSNDQKVEHDSTLGSTSVFSGTTAIMQPQDTRQYLYILTPKPEMIPDFPVIHQPGSVIPLGKLDISWRTGRLLTSVLSRRIPLLPVSPPAPAIPPHLQQSARPQSPGPNNRPGSPAFRVRNQPQVRSQSPGPNTAPPNSQHITRPDVEVDLVVRHIPRDAIFIDHPFKVDFTLTLSALLPSTAWPRPGVITPAQASIARDRIIHLVVQHMIPPRPAAISQSLASAQNATIAPQTPALPPAAPAAPYALRRSQSTLSLARRSDSTVWGDGGSTASDSPVATTLIQSPTTMSYGDRPDRPKTTLPSPFRDVSAIAGSRPGQTPGDDPKHAKDESGVVFLGSSVVRFPSFRLVSPPSPKTPKSPTSPKSPRSPRSPERVDAATTPPKDHEDIRARSSVDFSLEYVPLREGYSAIGGLRVLMVEDREVLPDEEDNSSRRDDGTEPKVIKEWDLIGEVWVTREGGGE